MFGHWKLCPILTLILGHPVTDIGTTDIMSVIGPDIGYAVYGVCNMLSRYHTQYRDKYIGVNVTRHRDTSDHL